MPNRDPFARVDRLLAAAKAGGDELDITSLVAYASARESQCERVDRSFRYEIDRGAWIHLQLTAPRASAWRARTEEQLQRAGYESWLLDDDELDARRWLTRAAEHEPELAFLEALGTRASPTVWPKRRPKAGPKPLMRPRFLETIERVRASAFRPTECWLSARVMPSTRVGALTVGASLTEIGRFAFIFATIHDAKDRTRPLPVSTHRKLRQMLSAEGYEQARYRSPGQRTDGSRRVVSPERAIAETKRIQNVMAAHVRAMQR